MGLSTSPVQLFGHSLDCYSTPITSSTAVEDFLDFHRRMTPGSSRLLSSAQQSHSYLQIITTLPAVFKLILYNVHFLTPTSLPTKFFKDLKRYSSQTPGQTPESNLLIQAIKPYWKIASFLKPNKVTKGMFNCRTIMILRYQLSSCLRKGGILIFKPRLVCGPLISLISPQLTSTPRKTAPRNTN